MLLARHNAAYMHPLLSQNISLTLVALCLRYTQTQEVFQMTVMCIKLFDDTNDEKSIAAGRGCWQHMCLETIIVASCQHERIVYLP